MKLALAIFPACLLAQSISLNWLSGSWVHQQENANITRVTIRTEGSRAIVHVWGKCTPDDCDWGETDVDLGNGTPMATWKQGFATRQMPFVQVPDGRMIVAEETVYLDGSGRKDTGHADFYLRQEAAKEDPQAAPTRALLAKTAEAYRNLPAAYFEAVNTLTRTTFDTEIRTVSHARIWSGPQGKLRIETASGRGNLIQIADGAVEWRIYPESNQYTNAPQAQGAALMSPFRTFALLDTARGAPRIVGQETVGDVACTRVEIAPSGAPFCKTDAAGFMGYGVEA